MCAFKGSCCAMTSRDQETFKITRHLKVPSCAKLFALYFRVSTFSYCAWYLPDNDCISNFYLVKSLRTDRMIVHCHSMSLIFYCVKLHRKHPIVLNYFEEAWYKFLELKKVRKHGSKWSNQPQVIILHLQNLNINTNLLVVSPCWVS